MLPGIKSYATCIKFNPHLYKKKNEQDKPPALLDLPYRVIFCIGTIEQVLIYSTECIYPLAVVGNMHYGHMNDFAWDFAGRKLLGASSDGYISMINFNGDSSYEILGERLPLSDIPEKLRPTFEAFELVTYKKYEEEAKEAKKNQFKPMTFKSKNAGGGVVVSNISIATPAPVITANSNNNNE